MEFGLIGRNLSHSYSKIIHEAIGKYNYDLYPLEPSHLEEFLRRGQFKGLNVTIPYKEKVMPFCHAIDEIGQKIGALNTLYFKDGKLHGTNTDYYGFLRASAMAGITYENKKVIILGNGATSLTVLHGVLDSGVREVLRVSREKKEDTITYDELKHHYDGEIIINTTPVGMYPNNGESLIDLGLFKNCSGVFDVIYNPYYTKLLMDAKSLNIPYSNGLPMLALQGIKAAEFFTGESVSQEKEREIVTSLAKEILNIVLIGMPGCGKSTIGRLLSESIKKPFIDTDALISKEAGKSIPEIFSQDGEVLFRHMESDIIKSLSKKSGTIISTGGGSVLLRENMENLMQNSIIFFIKRDIKKLSKEDRPLSTDLEKIYKKRAPLYKEYASFIINNDRNPEDAVISLLEVMNTL